MPRGRLVLICALTLCGFAANSLLTRRALAGGLAGPASFVALRLLSGAAVEGLLAARIDAGYPPPACAPGSEPAVAPSFAMPGAMPPAAADGTVTLTYRELVRLIEDAVERFARGGAGRA